MAPRVAAAGPRLLLKRLREVMAGQGTPDERLAAAVRQVAANMVAEVCSVYLLRSGDVLELYATEGLKPESVHITRLRVGEGLVGDIAAKARPLALADAQSHPQFAYRPETGEEIYHSLLGVPILRGGRMIGVLVVQNRTRRRYVEEEIEAMETIAMVLAEMVVSGQFLPPEELQKLSRRPQGPHRAVGRALAKGLAIGVAVLHEPRVAVVKAVADDVEMEVARLENAIQAMRESIDRMLANPGTALVGESREIFEAFQMFAHDAGWRTKLREAVESGLTAEAAVQRVQADVRHRMGQVGDPYLRERLADFEDLANRLLLHLAGRSPTVTAESLPENAIVFARNLGPAELLEYHRGRLAAVVLEEGAPYSHVAIVARGLGIAVVGGAADVIAEVEAGDQVIVDGDHGQVFIRPAGDLLEAFRQNVADRQARLAKYVAQRDDPPVTRDGLRISLNINAGLLRDLDHLDETGADGVGLYRTELQFMVHGTFPQTDVQAGLYARVLDQAGDRPVVFRTLDVGGDKVLPSLGAPSEDNPVMGWRAIRISLDRPELLKGQVRALLQAAAGRDLNVMFPMISEVSEYLRARAVLDDVATRYRAQNKPMPRAIRVGAMLEVPALAWQLPALLPVVDFLSIGSNDLLQFMFAADRTNPRLADRYEPLSAPVLKFFRWIVRQCDAADVPVTLCGEMAGQPLDAMALIGVGLRRISVPASAIGPIREMVRSLDTRPLEAFINGIIDSPDHSLRHHLANFARAGGVVV
jgi:phosphotransferase system, enzyme I, PtsP